MAAVPRRPRCLGFTPVRSTGFVAGTLAFVQSSSPSSRSGESFPSEASRCEHAADVSEPVASRAASRDCEAAVCWKFLQPVEVRSGETDRLRRNLGVPDDAHHQAVRQAGCERGDLRRLHGIDDFKLGGEQTDFSRIVPWNPSRFQREDAQAEMFQRLLRSRGRNDDSVSAFVRPLRDVGERGRLRPAKDVIAKPVPFRDRECGIRPRTKPEASERNPAAARITRCDVEAAREFGGSRRDASQRGTRESDGRARGAGLPRNDRAGWQRHTVREKRCASCSSRPASRDRAYKNGRLAGVVLEKTHGLAAERDDLAARTVIPLVEPFAGCERTVCRPAGEQVAARRDSAARTSRFNATRRRAGFRSAR